MDRRLTEAIFTMLDDRYELRQRHEFERFDEIFFLMAAGGARIASTAGVRLLPTHSPSDEVSGAFGADPVGRLEDDPVSKVQNCYFGLFLTA